MIAMPSGASGISTVHRSIRNVRPSSHSKLTRPPPGHGGPPGGVASIVHSPARASSRSSAGFRLGGATRDTIGGMARGRIELPTPRFSPSLKRPRRTAGNRMNVRSPNNAVRRSYRRIRVDPGGFRTPRAAGVQNAPAGYSAGVSAANLDLVRRAYEAWNRGDLDAAFAFRGWGSTARSV